MTSARSEARDRILRATVSALGVHGYAGTTARSIATLGGFAPGVIYYHFTDLDELLVATAAYASAAREAQYRAAMTGVTSAAAMVRLVRSLYAEDTESGHVQAVQELVTAARPGTALAVAVAEQTRRWEDLAEEVLRTLLRGKPLARLVDARVVGRAAVAYFLGTQALTHIEQDPTRSQEAFQQAERLAAIFDKLPRRKRARATK
ncbi:TetR/AcrR family transcriptional regulator [Kutzneria buriramensis]|uniref:Regulatory TetR family protein n=1 Tax=Kutzneria buriramensis TaxID=1045776 RepID=A0A3E0HIG1_9PSEU|nr:TetR/AcrR family transcriptional regulator [Kutzneria buriramensis]REH46279.1 regulatory TetR family protein [Kutzneria buriramensis]